MEQKKQPVEIPEIEYSTEDRIQQYLEANLSISISSDTSDFYSTDGTTRTRFSVKLILAGKTISEDSYYE